MRGTGGECRSCLLAIQKPATPSHRHVFWDTWQDIACALALQKMAQGARALVCVYIYLYMIMLSHV